VLGGDVRGDLTLSVRRLQWGARCNVWSLAHLGEAMAGTEWRLSCSPESFACSLITQCRFPVRGARAAQRRTSAHRFLARSFFGGFPTSAPILGQSLAPGRHPKPFTKAAIPIEPTLTTEFDPLRKATRRLCYSVQSGCLSKAFPISFILIKTSSMSLSFVL